MGIILWLVWRCSSCKSKPDRIPEAFLLEGIANGWGKKIVNFYYNHRRKLRRGTRHTEESLPKPQSNCQRAYCRNCERTKCQQTGNRFTAKFGSDNRRAQTSARGTWSKHSWDGHIHSLSRRRKDGSWIKKTMGTGTSRDRYSQIWWPQQVSHNEMSSTWSSSSKQTIQQEDWFWAGTKCW